MGRKQTIFNFEVDGVEIPFTTAPIGWNEVEQKLKRAKKTEGLILDVLQNLKFVKDERTFLIEQEEQNGSLSQIKLTRKVYYNNDYELSSSGFVDMDTLKYDDTTASIDFVENELDQKLRDNLTTEFEIDRNTSLSGSLLPELEPNNYRYKSRSIFLTSFLKAIANNITLDLPTPATLRQTPKITIVSESDDAVQSVLIPFVNDNVSVSNVFYYQAEIDTTLRLTIKCKQTVTNIDDITPYIYRYENENLDFIDRIEILPLSDSGLQDFDEIIEIQVLEGQSLSFQNVINFQIGESTLNFEDDDISILIEDDSTFETTDPNELNIDCITIKDAFTRIATVIDADLQFESDYLDTNWNNVVLFSGETLRHMQRNNEKVSLGTFSFQMLFDFLNTLRPVTFFLERKGTRNILRIEDRQYVFDTTSNIYLGIVPTSQIEVKVNPDKIYSKVRIGYENSGKNEDVAGYYSTHPVNEYNLPVDSDNTYEATNKIIVDPTDIELTFRKQYRTHPDEDTKRDNNIFAIDAKLNNSDYVARVWQDDFQDIQDIYDRDSAYNFRFSPINCLYRHGFNFKQEYMKPVYNESSISFLNSKGNADYSTTLIGGVERGERGTFLLSTFGDALYGTNEITIKKTKTRDIEDQINGKNSEGKRNFYTAVEWKDAQGATYSGFITEATIKNDLKIEMYNGI